MSEQWLSARFTGTPEIRQLLADRIHEFLREQGVQNVNIQEDQTGSEEETNEPVYAGFANSAVTMGPAD